MTFRHKIRHTLIRLFAPAAYWAGKRAGRREALANLNAQLEAGCKTPNELIQTIDTRRRMGWSELQIAQELDIPVSTLQYLGRPVRNRL